MPSATAIVHQGEALTLAVDLLANDLENRAEVGALTAAIEKDAVFMLTRARKLVDDFAAALPRLALPSKAVAGKRRRPKPEPGSIGALFPTNGRKS
jgi:hypothetical protein